MKTLIIHHLESTWSAGYASHGTTFEEQCENVCEHLRENDYDRVILVLFEDWKLTDDHIENGLAEFVTDVETYGYGWEREMIDDGGIASDQKWCDGGTHSEIVLIDQWMIELTGEIHLCGAFDGECIEDIELALTGACKEFTRIESLIV